MKKWLGMFLMMTTMMALDGYAQANLLGNGNFENGKSEWKGKYEVVLEGNNKIGVIELDERKLVDISQKFKVKDMKNVKLTFRYKTSPGFQSRGMTVVFEREDGGSTYQTMDVNANTEWQQYSWDFREIRETRKFTVIISLKEGVGQFFLDDVVLIEN